VNFSADQRAFMQALPDATFRQSVRDLMVNQSFRRDYWVKGPGQLTALQQLEALSAERVVLVSHRSDVELKFTTALGEAVLYAPVYDPLLDLLADHQPKTIGEVARAMQARGVGFKQVVEALVMLAGKGHVMSAQDETVIAQVGVSVRRLNDGLLDRARSSGNTKVLASPVTGGGINVTRAVQNFLLAHRAGCNSPAELADSVWRLLESQGQRVIKGEMALEAAEANIAELALQASKFLEQRLPVLKALQIA
jgi:predicted transcriptional regulator